MDRENDELGPATQLICQQIWPNMQSESLLPKFYTAAIRYLRSELEKAELRPHGGVGMNPALEAEVLACLQCFQSDVDLPRAAALDSLQQRLDNGGLQASLGSVPDAKARLAEYLGRIWLHFPISLDTSSQIRTLSNDKFINWGDKVSLREVIGSYFNRLKADSAKTGPLSGDEIIPRHFTAAYLVKNYRWRIRWTHSLIEHLRIDWANKIINVYEHKVWLLNHRDHSSDCPIPADALEEAIDTLNLLFPPFNRATKKFLASQGRHFGALGLGGRQEIRHLSHYKYWHTSLAHLRTELKAPPYGWRQLLPHEGNENLMQLLTFWVTVGLLAILTIVFGGIASYFSFKAYELTLLQYQLSLMQACLEPGANETMPGFCS